MASSVCTFGPGFSWPCNATMLRGINDSLYIEDLLRYRGPDLLTWCVVSVDQRGAYVDMGGKQPLFCPVSEASVCKLQKVSSSVPACLLGCCPQRDPCLHTLIFQRL